MSLSERLTEQAQCTLPTEWGEFLMTVYIDSFENEYIALSLGQLNTPEPVLTRIHSECLTGDAFFSRRCDCGAQLQQAMKTIQQHQRGLIIYLRQEGRGIGLLNKIKAYHLQENGMDTVEANLALGLPADARDFSIVRDILNNLGVQSLRLMTNNPLKIKQLEKLGINITERLPIIVGVHEQNENYLATKAKKMGHFIDIKKS